MELRLPVAAITDEFTPDLEAAAEAMAAIGMTGAELRVLWGKNIMDLSDAELDQAKAILGHHGLKVISIASPLLKCVLPDSPPLDSRFEHDVFASAHTFEDQPRLLRRACEIAHKMGAPIIRVFSFWRAVDPAKCSGPLAEALRAFVEKAAAEDLILGLENEHACNAATGAETAAILKAVGHPNLKVIWDPATPTSRAKIPFPTATEPSPRGASPTCMPRTAAWRTTSRSGCRWRPASRLERPVRRPARGRLPRLGESGNALGRPRRRQVPSQRHLRLEFARPAHLVTSNSQAFAGESQ